MADIRPSTEIELELHDYIGSAYSPTVEVTETEDGHTVSITSRKASGIVTDEFDVKDGFDPVATVARGDHKAVLTVTDKFGTTTSDIPDGVSPRVEITEDEDGHTVSITDAYGTQSYEVPDWSGDERERVEAEERRVAAESARATAESQRVAAETQRASAETARKSAENARSAAEGTRVQSEAQRAANEAQRAAGEVQRGLNEQARVASETARETAWETMSADVLSATDDANEAAATAMGVSVSMLGNTAHTTVTGTSVHASDAISFPPVGLEVHGASVQSSTPSTASPKPISHVTSATVRVTDGWSMPVDLDGNVLRSAGGAVDDIAELSYAGVGATEGTAVYDVTLHANVGTVTLNGTEDWSLSSLGLLRTTAISDLVRLPKSTTELIPLTCTQAVATSYADLRSTTGSIAIAESGNVFVNLPSITTVGAIRTWLSNHPMTVVYPLATPSDTSLGSVTLQSLPAPEFTMTVDGGAVQAPFDLSYVYDVSINEQERADEWLSLKSDAVQATSDAGSAATSANAAATSASAAATNANATASSISAAAARGDYDGYSPTVAIADTELGHTVTITDRQGPHAYTVPTYADEEQARQDAWDQLSQDAQEAIDAATEAAESVSDDVDALYNGIDMLRFDIRTAEAEGGMTQTENAAKAVPVGLAVDGVSTQVTTTGKNLLSDVMTDWPYSSISGASRPTLLIPVESGATYTYSRNTTGTLAFIVYWYNDETEEKADAGTSPTWTNYTGQTITNDGGWTHLSIACTSVTTDLLRSREAQLEKASTATAYEQYSGGKPSPSPNYQQEILSVDAPVLTMVGKNLLDMDAFADISNWDTSGLYMAFPLSVPVDADLVAHYDGSAVSSSALTLNFMTVKGSSASGFLIHSSYPNPTRTVTSTSGVVYLNAYPKAQATIDSIIELLDGRHLRVELGTEATAYEPYIGVTAPINLQGHELRSLPDGTEDQLNLTYDRPSKRAGWSWYKAELVQRVGNAAIEALTGWQTYTIGGHTVFRSTRPSGHTNTSGTARCSALAVTTVGPGSMADNSVNINAGYWTATHHLVIRCDSCATVAELLELVGDASLTYKLATPVTETLPDIELPVIPTKDATVYVTGGSVQPAWHMDYQIDADAELVQVHAELDEARAQVAQLWGNQLTGELSGTIDTASDAYAAPPMALSVDGTSTQVTTTGKNLINPATKTLVLDEPMPAGTALTASCAGNSGQVRYYDADGNQIDYWTTRAISGSTRYGVTFTLLQDAYMFRWVDSSSATMERQLEVGTTATAYEPYTGGKPTPNPDYQQDILSVDDLSLVLASVNLFDKDHATTIDGYSDSGGKIRGNANNRMVVIPVCPNTSYSVQVTIVTTAARQNWSIHVFDTMPEVNSIESYSFAMHFVEDVSIGHRFESTFTTTDTARYICISIGNNTTGYDWVATSATIQLELGSTVTAYEPYIGTVVPLYDGTLRSLPDGTRDTLRLSYLRPSTREGWAWYGREVVQRVGELDLGDQTWRKSNRNYANTGYIFNNTNVTDIAPLAKSGLCTSYVNAPNFAYNGANERLLYGQFALKQSLYANGWLLVCDEYATADDFKAAVSGVTVLYPRSTPVTTQLDPIELPELPAPTCTVWCDGGSAQPTYSMQYVQDTNIVIADLRAALADLATS